MKWLLRLLLGVLVLGLVGCGSTPKPKIVDIGDEAINISESINKNVDVYIDWTSSMAGFATKDTATSYISMINDISTLSESFSGTIGQVHYYGFGDKITEITQQQFRGAVNEEFFTKERATRIYAVLSKIRANYNQKKKESKVGRVSIVITDLFEDNSNMEPIIKSVKNGLINANISTGILGIKSYFNGKVFDVGRNKPGRDYKSQIGNKNTYRPFYVFIIGETGNVISYYNSLNTSYSLRGVQDKMKYFELFSVTKTLKLGEIVNTALEADENNKKPRLKLDKDSEDVISNKITMLKAFTGGASKEDKKMEYVAGNFKVYPIKGSRLEYALKNGTNVYKKNINNVFLPIVKVEKFNKKDYELYSKPTVKAIDYKIHSDKDNIDVKLGINPFEFEAGNYRISLNLEFNPELLKPIIPETWNMKAETDSGFGCKTIYLNNVLEGLYRLTYTKEKPIIKSYYYFRIIK